MNLDETDNRKAGGHAVAGMSGGWRSLMEPVPHWAGDTIKPFDENAFNTAQRFPLTHYCVASGDLNVYRVVGTRHHDYAGMTWAGLYVNGKRMDINHRLLEEHPVYYTDPEHKKPTMDFVSLNGLDWYVDGDGKHRTCIARFYFYARGLTQLRGVLLHDWRTDTDFVAALAVCKSIIKARRLPWDLNTAHEIAGREDTAGWYLDRYHNYATLTAPESVTRRFPSHLDCAALKRLADFADQPAWRRLWTSGP